MGAKYFFIKSERENFFSEAGIRNSRTNPSHGDFISYSTSGRLYSEHMKKSNDSVLFKLWAEYLQTQNVSRDYLLNYEPSISVMMNQIFSIKTAYLVKYHNKVLTEKEKKEDTSFTTALVAKF